MPINAGQCLLTEKQQQIGNGCDATEEFCDYPCQETHAYVQTIYISATT